MQQRMTNHLTNLLTLLTTMSILLRRITIDEEHAQHMLKHACNLTKICNFCKEATCVIIIFIFQIQSYLLQVNHTPPVLPLLSLIVTVNCQLHLRVVQLRTLVSTVTNTDSQTSSYLSTTVTATASISF